VNGPVDPVAGVSGPLFHLALLNPEIPNNTGNIGRTAAALGCRLHVIHPIGFDMDEKARRRAGLDYWHLVDCREHADWASYLAAERPARLWMFSARGSRSHLDADFRPGDTLLFGKESTGVDPATASWAEATYGPECRLTIPMRAVDGMRSLNLATAVAIAAYEGFRQVRARGEQPGGHWAV
jgi:tRNA (cytidine/uridine-2'-O-)-methyltransferase